MKRRLWILLLVLTLTHPLAAQKSKTDSATTKKKGWRLFGNKKNKELEAVSKEKDKVSEEKKKVENEKQFLEWKNQNLSSQIDALDQQKKALDVQQHFLDSQLVVRNQSLKLMTEAQMKIQLTLLRQKQLLDSISFAKVIDSLKISDQQKILTQKEDQLRRQEAEVELQQSQRNLLIVVVLGVLVVALGIYRSLLNVKKYSKIIEEEKNKSEYLLLNILPKEVADELKKSGAAEAKHYEEVSVLFSDFVGFTFLAEKLPPQELVAELDYCFKRFDRIMGNNKIEKIKTIGDAYMAAGGVPVPDSDAHVRIVRAALELQEFIEARKQQRLHENLPFFEARVGIHTGEVVAGIVGEKKFAFDLWGDTVNIASRMESASLPGKVNISEDTYELVKSHFICSDRGKKDIKNRGEKGMFFVEREVLGD